MKKIEYLLLALTHKLYFKQAWLITAFSVTRPKENEPRFIGKLIPQPWGFDAINAAGENEKIEDAVPNEPLFSFKDRLTIDSKWLETITQPIETSIGTLLTNFILLQSPFGKKFPYVNGKVTIEKLEDMIALKLKDTVPEDKKDSNFYYVDEYIKFVDAIQFLSTITQLCTISATPKNITPPTGIKEFKAQLLKKYEGKMNDPVEVSKFEQELMDFDSEYLKGDPSDGTFMAGKLKNNSRKKMFLTQGPSSSFKDSIEVIPVINSLDEGMSTDPIQFSETMNGLRYGSYARGTETIKGGVAAKILLRSANNFKITDTDCNSKLGIRRTYNSKTIDELVTRSIVVNGKTIFIENNTIAANYLDKQLVVRSPMFCKLPGETICKVCAGDKLARVPTGVTIPLTEISSILLAASMKQMHVSTLTTAKIDLKKVFS
jgi:hypothetical protein